MADIRSKFGLPVDEDFVLSDYPTLNHMIGYIKKMSGELPGPVEVVATTAALAAEVTIDSTEVVSEVIEDVVSNSGLEITDESLTKTVIEVVVQHTGYPIDFIELDQDLEGELGIDTVKQAEIMADIRSKFGLPVDEDFVLSDYPTLNHMIAYIQKMSGEAVVSQEPVIDTPVVQTTSAQETPMAEVVKPSITQSVVMRK